jgi:hypothetical protein
MRVSYGRYRVNLYFVLLLEPLLSQEERPVQLVMKLPTDKSRSKLLLLVTGLDMVSFFALSEVSDLRQWLLP